MFSILFFVCCFLYEGRKYTRESIKQQDGLPLWEWRFATGEAGAPSVLSVSLNTEVLPQLEEKRRGWRRHVSSPSSCILHIHIHIHIYIYIYIHIHTSTPIFFYRFNALRNTFSTEMHDFLVVHRWIYSSLHFSTYICFVTIIIIIVLVCVCVGGET